MESVTAADSNQSNKFSLTTTTKKQDYHDF